MPPAEVSQRSTANLWEELLRISAGRRVVGGADRRRRVWGFAGHSRVNWKGGTRGERSEAE
jgi:hypothetical protein